MLFPFIKTSLKKEIIPVINVKTKQKFEERLKILKDFKGTFQIDIADGVFTGFKNWSSAEDLKTIKHIRNKFELHLMIQNVEKQLPLWLETKPKRIIVHLEALHNFEDIYKTIKNNKVELALALNPDTPISFLENYIKYLNFVVLLGVDPGPSGQKFRYFVLDKIKDLREKYPKINIELDGGVNEEIAKEAIRAGANILAIGSAIFETENPKEKIKEFEELLNKI